MDSTKGSIHRAVIGGEWTESTCFTEQCCGSLEQSPRLSSVEQEWTINLALLSRLCGLIVFYRDPNKDLKFHFTLILGYYSIVFKMTL